ncbi:hypothetical protein NC651_022652 [Populus alba x Populus x berolinensis]|nr:hypothetical protein NC651_022652 [Populus alba x Populus x berolinensis]
MFWVTGNSLSNAFSSNTCCCHS